MSARFLSTPSSQRATRRRHGQPLAGLISIHALFAEGDTAVLNLPYHVIRISIHALFAEGDRVCGGPGYEPAISIHALFAEGDSIPRPLVSKDDRFLSTPSSQRATPLRGRVIRGEKISIHALFAEGDDGSRSPARELVISIHALFAEGDAASDPAKPPGVYFYPRPLRRGRHQVDSSSSVPSSISIHALFAEGDRGPCAHAA